MSFSFNDVKGNTITASIVQYDNATPSWRGIYAGEPIPTFFNMLDYITTDSNIISNPISYLLQDRTISEAEAHINSIKNDLFFVWGDITNGGLCIYRTGVSTYGIALFGCSGIKKSDNNIIRYWGNPFYGNQAMSAWQLAQTFVGEGRQLDRSPEYLLYFPNVNQGGVGMVRQCGPDFKYQDPTNPERITDVDWILSSVYYRLDETLNDSSYFVVMPLLGDNYTQPYMTAHYNDMTNTATWAEFGDSANYDITGSWYGGDDNEVDVDPNQSSGTTSTGGGWGTPSNNSDEVDFPPSEQYSNDAYNSGFVTAYLPTKEEIQALNDYLFTGITEAASLVIKRIMTNPMDFIISIGMIHYTPSTLSTEEIQFCGLGTGVFAQPVEKQIYELMCGSINVEEQFKNFLDYGYSRFRIYLPYCGIFPLSDDVMHSTVTLKYVVDNFTGNCVAMLKCVRNKRCEGDANNLKSVLYRFTGNCMSQVPISSTDWKSWVNGGITTLSGALGVATGNPAGLATMASGVLNMSPEVIRSGSVHTDYGFMDEHTPYLILERPIQAIPQQFYDYRGYVSNITKKLKECKGFTKVSSSTFWSMNIRGTDEEMNEIKQLLLEGVYIE